MVYIFDLDGTIANVNHRADYAKAKQWDEFHARSDADEVYEKVAQLMRDLEDSFIIVLTGRPERYRAATSDWLAKHDIYPDDLLMRPDDDYTRDAELKLQILYQLFNGREAALEKVTMIFEDREQVVEGFRNAGFTCAQIRNGAF